MNDENTRLMALELVKRRRRIITGNRNKPVQYSVGDILRYRSNRELMYYLHQQPKYG